MRPRQSFITGINEFRYIIEKELQNILNEQEKEPWHANPSTDEREEEYTVEDFGGDKEEFLQYMKDRKFLDTYDTGEDIEDADDAPGIPGHRSHRSHSPYAEDYRNELMQHLMDSEGMDEEEAEWAANEMESGRGIGLESGIRYDPAEHFGDTHGNWQDRQTRAQDIQKPAPEPADVDPTIKPLDTSSFEHLLDPTAAGTRAYYTPTEVTESLAK
jgi:hypothetical protein